MANTKSRLIIVNKSGAGELSNYTQHIPVDCSGWGNMDTTGDDVRFYDAGHNLIDHYVLPLDDGRTTIKSANTSFFVRIPTVAASGNTLITMEYGDGALVNSESGTNAFSFFDDFLVGGGAALNGTRWPTTTGTWTEIDGPPKAANGAIASGECIATNNVGLARSGGLLIISKSQLSVITTTGRQLATGWRVDANNYIACGPYNDGGTRKAGIYTKAGSGTANFNFDNVTYYTSLIKATPTSIDYFYNYLVTPADKVTYANDADTGTGYIRMYSYSLGSASVAKFDYIGACSYDSTVTVTSVGAEADLGPIIDTVVPSSGYQGETVAVTITGANFEETPSVVFIKGAETITATGEHFTSSAQIECDIPIGVAETLGWWDCTVTNP